MITMCPNCYAEYEVDDDARGEQVVCEECQTTFEVRSVEAVAADAELAEMQERAKAQKYAKVIQSVTVEEPDFIRCPECGKKVSKFLTNCPQCSAVLRESPDEDKTGLVRHSKLHLRKTYIVLAVLLGVLGVHNFYAGYTRDGLLPLFLTVISFALIGQCWFLPWIVLPLLELLAISNAITRTKDMQGYPMQ